MPRNTQFTLRTLFITVAIIAFTFGALREVCRVYESCFGVQRRAIRTIEQLGGEVAYFRRSGVRLNDAWSVTIDIHHGNKDRLDVIGGCLRSMPRLQVLTLRGLAITDDDLRAFHGLRSLVWLNLCCTSVRGHGLRHFDDSQSLGYIYITDSPVIDGGLKSLEVLRSVKYLELVVTQDTDSALAKCAGIKLLRGSDGSVLQSTTLEKMEPVGR
jgi:hypothetical protein